MATQARKQCGGVGRRSEQLERHWRRAVTAWSRSGQTQVAFCREGSLSLGAFRWWKCELNRRDAERSTPSRALSSTRQASTGSTRFVAVRVKESGEGEATNGPGVIEVRLRGGHQLRVHGDVDATALATVVGVLEGRPC